MLWNKINIMLPTYNRSETKLPNFINSALKTCSTPSNICFTFVCNEKDEKTITYINARLNGIANYHIIKENLSEPHLAKYFNMAYTDTKFKEPSTCVSMFGDDFVFKTDNWDKIFLDWINSYNGIGIFYGDDCFRFGNTLATMFVTTRKYIDAIQTPQDPFVSTLFPIDEIDLLHTEIAKRISRLFYIKHIKIAHRHATISGNMDDVWKRLRTQQDTLLKNKQHSPQIIEDCVARAHKNLANELNPPIRVIMTTRNRLSILNRTISSYNNSNPLPPQIDVFDDNSTEPVADAINTMKNAVFHRSTEHLGAAHKTPAAMHEIFSNTSVDAIIVIDSDTSFYPTWYARACAIYNQIKDRQDTPLISLYNENTGIVCADNTLPCVVRKLGIGALGMIITRKFWEKYIKDYPTWSKLKTWDWWDIKVSQRALNDGNLVGATSPSLLQHIGIYEGAHGSLANTAFAEDFLGDQEFIQDLQFAINDNSKTNKVLVSLQGRHGDCILGSLVVNMIIDEGYSVDWLTLPNYKDLVKLTCPRAKIILNSTIPDSYFMHTDTATMRQMYPDYKYYINLQPGAPENHSRFMSSGKNMPIFVKELAESVLGIKLPDDFKKYRTIAQERNIDMRWYNGTRPIAIIAPECVSVKSVMTDKWIRQKYEELSKEYCTKIIVKQRPNLPISMIRQMYLCGYSFIDCIFLLKHASLLYVHDSGLAWAAIYSDMCRKKVLHDSKGFIHVRYSEFDDTYEDIIVNNIEEQYV